MAEVAATSGWSGLAPGLGARLYRRLAANLAAEGERRLLWVPVFFGAGIGLYFTLKFEPPLWSSAIPAVCFALAWAVRRHRRVGPAAILLAVAAAGFALMVWTAWRVGAPILYRRLGPAVVTGRIVDLDRLGRGWRIILTPDPLPGLDAARQPRLLRLHVRAANEPPMPGERVRLKAMLYPVPGPVLPGGYDLQRTAYFAGIGGVGYSYGAARRIGAAAPDLGWRETLRALRSRMTQRITTVLPGAAGGIAAALITGKRGAIPDKVKGAFRAAGLAHLLAISGLHLGLVAAFVFFAVRGGLALSPRIALRYPIKKIAAAATLAALACYLMISGAAIPTQRAFVMNGIVFAAILIDRLRISMRICAFAAFAVLAVEPESLTGPSFQMSFGAVVTLIAAYEAFGVRLGRVLRRPSLPGQVLGYVGAVVVTTIVATIGTAPFSIYHFHRIALYSPLANILAVPLSAVWTIPCGVVACLSMPFGLARPALVAMGWGIDATIWMAEHVASLPGDVWPTPRLPLFGLLLVVFGGLWLCLWRGGWRRWGIVGVAAGLATMALTRPPDVVISEGGRLVAVRAPDGHYLATSGWNTRIARSFLAEETGEKLTDWPKSGDPKDGLVCGGALCRYRARGRRVAIVTGWGGMPRDCRSVDAIVAQVPAGFRCRGIVPVIDRIDSWEQGAVALWLNPSGITIESANGSRGFRPWVPWRHPPPHSHPY